MRKVAENNLMDRAERVQLVSLMAANIYGHLAAAAIGDGTAYDRKSLVSSSVERAFELLDEADYQDRRSRE